MKRKLINFVLLVLIILFPSVALAFNSASHLYIAERVFPDNNYKIDLHYGSISPDLALYVLEQHKWPTSFTDTHYDYIILMPYAWSQAQEAFSKGWGTHNEVCGADYYAHIEYPQASGKNGYVIDKALILSKLTNLDPEFAHYAIEVAVDLLLKHDDPSLAEKLLRANKLRSRQDINLLAAVLVWKERRTDFKTLTLTEWIFRNLVDQYASALVLPSPIDRYTLAVLGSWLAKEIYGIDVSVNEVLFLIETAMELCKNDYKVVIDDIIEIIENSILSLKCNPH